MVPRMTDLKTLEGKEAALTALRERRANRPEQINDASLPAGSPIHAYCKSCGHMAEVLPESYDWRPKRLCDECQALKDLGWLE